VGEVLDASPPLDPDHNDAGGTRRRGQRGRHGVGLVRRVSPGTAGRSFVRMVNNGSMWQVDEAVYIGPLK
jgi:hypothetical protein